MARAIAERIEHLRSPTSTSSGLEIEVFLNIEMLFGEFLKLFQDIVFEFNLSSFKFRCQFYVKRFWRE